MRLAGFLALCGLLAAPLQAQTGRVETHHFRSQALGVTKHFVVYLPPSYSTQRAKRYPVAYYLHGAGDDEGMYISKGRLDLVMDSLIAAGTPEMIVVMPDGDDGWWSDRNDRSWEAPCAGNARSDEPAATYCVVRAMYATYLVRELVPLVDSLFRTRPNRRTRGVAGASMGAFGALTVAFANPDLFSAAASTIGAVSLTYVGTVTPSGYAARVDDIAAYWRARGRATPPGWALVFGPDIAQWENHDPLRLASRLAAANRAQLPAILLDAAQSDTTFLPMSHALRDGLRRAGIAHDYSEFPGRHDWTAVEQRMAPSLSWMARRIAEPERRVRK